MDDAVVIDDECHHPGIALMCRPRDQSNPPTIAVDDVAGRTAGRVCALAGQHLEIVPMIGGSAALRGSNDRDSQA